MEDDARDTDLHLTYREMAQDADREAEALEWAEATCLDVADEDDQVAGSGMARYPK